MVAESLVVVDCISEITGDLVSDEVHRLVLRVQSELHNKVPLKKPWD